ncbi:hypothetical protein [Parasphingorhabdus pacifica]
MAFSWGMPVAAGLSQVAQMDRGQRARIVRQVCDEYPGFRGLLKQVSVARGVAFASGLALAVAVILLVQAASVWWVAALVFTGLGGFGYVTVVLTDSRFDLLLAVLGAHRTDELHGRLVTDQIYGEEPVAEPVQPSLTCSRARGRLLPVEPAPRRGHRVN